MKKMAVRRPTDDKGVTIVNPYQTILSQRGMSEFKALIQKWEAIAGSIRQKPAALPQILPDLFLVSDSGTGRTLLLRLLADYLSVDERLMEFYGDVKYVEFLLNYCPPEEYFSEIPRLMTEISTAAGFRNEYRGIVYLDIDPWVGHCEERHFLEFLEYVSDNSDNWLVVFSVSREKGREAIDELESLLSAFLRIERIALESPSASELTDFLIDRVKGYGFTFSEEAKALLTETVTCLRKTEYFDGYKTVKRLGVDIVYAACAAGKQENACLEVDDLAEFAPVGPYVSRQAVKIEKIKRIGF